MRSGDDGHRHTEELLVTAGLLDDLDDTGLQLLDGRNVVGEDTHLAGLSGDVDLDDILRLVNGLRAAISSVRQLDNQPWSR